MKTITFRPDRVKAEPLDSSSVGGDTAYIGFMSLIDILERAELDEGGKHEKIVQITIDSIGLTYKTERRKR